MILFVLVVEDDVVVFVLLILVFWWFCFGFCWKWCWLIDVEIVCDFVEICVDLWVVVGFVVDCFLCGCYCRMWIVVNMGCFDSCCVCFDVYWLGGLFCYVCFLVVLKIVLCVMLSLWSGIFFECNFLLMIWCVYLILLFFEMFFISLVVLSLLSCWWLCFCVDFDFLGVCSIGIWVGIGKMFDLSIFFSVVLKCGLIWENVRLSMLCLFIFVVV